MVCWPPLRAVCSGWCDICGIGSVHPAHNAPAMANWRIIGVPSRSAVKTIYGTSGPRYHNLTRDRWLFETTAVRPIWPPSNTANGAITPIHHPFSLGINR